MDQKHQHNKYHANVSSRVENVTQIKIGLMINDDVSKNIRENIFMKKVILGTFVHVLQKMVNI